MGGLNLLTDPVFSERAFPVCSGWGPAGSWTPGLAIDELPPLDVVLVSHMSGMGFGETAGVQVFVAPSLSLDGGISVGVGKLGNVKVDGPAEDWGTPNNTTTTRLKLGANWYP